MDCNMAPSLRRSLLLAGDVSSMRSDKTSANPPAASSIRAPSAAAVTGTRDILSAQVASVLYSKEKERDATQPLIPDLRWQRQRQASSCNSQRASISCVELA